MERCSTTFDAPREDGDPVSPGTLRAAFCARYRCAESRFLSLAMWQAIPPQVRPLAWFVHLLDREHFKADLDLLRRVGQALTMDDVRAELRAFHYDNVYSRPFLRQRLRIRVSSKRVLRLASRLLS